MRETQWKKLVQIHNHAKSVFLLAEEYDPQSKDFIQPAMELRHALEHIIRAYASELNASSSGAEGRASEYAEQSFDKAIGHEYRAFFDAADWLSVSIREKMHQDLRPYSTECIAHVMPDYYSYLRPRIDSICGEIAVLRGAKDVARGTDIEDCVGRSDQLIGEVDRYRRVLNELLESYQTLQSRIPSMNEWKSKHRQQQVMQFIIFGVIAALLSGIITAYIVMKMGWGA